MQKLEYFKLCKWIVGMKSHQCLAYADNIIHLERTDKELKRLTQIIEKVAGKAGLLIRKGKTKYMVNEYMVSKRVMLEIWEGKIHRRIFEEKWGMGEEQQRGTTTLWGKPQFVEVQF